MAPVRRAGSVAIVPAGTVGNNYASLVTLPAGIQTGDIGIITTSFVNPNSTATGWTKLQLQGTYLSQAVFWKVMNSSDSGTTVTINGGGWARASVASVEIWGGALSPTVAFAKLAANGTPPTTTAAVGSVPLFAWVGVDASGGIPPSTISTPSGWAGTYLRAGSNANDPAVGMWFNNPMTGTTTPSFLVNSGGNAGITATITLPPSVVNNAYIAGSTSAGDVLCSVVLAGSTASADTTLLWTP